MLRKIITSKTKLAEDAVEINIEENRELAEKIVKDLQDTIKSRNLEALSAPQIGYPYRIFSIHYPGQGTKIPPATLTYINPVIVSSSEDRILDREKDPCLPNREFLFLRSKEIMMTYQTLMKDHEGMAQKFNAKTAAIMQQMVDHLDGIMIDEPILGLEIDYRFDEAADDEKSELVGAYLNNLKEYLTWLNEEIEKNDLTKKTSEAVEFIKSVRSGETTFSGTISMNADHELIDSEDN